MKKTLLIAAAALAAGVISSQAQVYSQNIVGYVNTSLPLGFVNIANPLDAAGTVGINNSITNLINVFSGNYDGDALYLWSGTSYTTYVIDSSWPTGVGNGADSAAVTPPNIAPGVAIFIQNTVGSNTLTFTGTVHVDGAGASTNVVGLATNTLPASPQFSYVSSKIAVGGLISTTLQLPKDGSLDGCALYIPNVVAGQVKGFNTVVIDSSWSTGFGNGADSAQVAEPSIPVGTGFFFYNTLGVPVNWIQSY